MQCTASLWIHTLLIVNDNDNNNYYEFFLLFFFGGGGAVVLYLPAKEKVLVGITMNRIKAWNL